MLSSDTTFYSALGESVTLNITVRVFPVLTDLMSAFVWYRNDGMQITDGVSSLQLTDEVFFSEMLITSVTEKDYSAYKIIIDNGIQEAKEYTLTLLDRGNFCQLFLLNVIIYISVH